MSAAATDSILVYDPSRRRASVWHAQSGFVRSIRIPGTTSLESWPDDVWPLGADRLVALRLAVGPRGEYSGARIRRWQTRAQLTLHDAGGVQLAHSPSFNGPYSGLVERGDVRLPFSNRPFVAVGRDRTVFGSGQEYILSILDRDFRHVGEIRWPAQSEALTDAEIERVKDDIRAILPSDFPAARASRLLDESFASEILPVTRPAIGRVFTDSDDRIWVERFEAQRLGSAVIAFSDQWTVLDGHGRPIARLRLPPNTRLESVAGSQLLAVTSDSLDVPRLVVYRHRPLRPE